MANVAVAFRFYVFSLGFLPFILNQTTEPELFYCVDWNCEEFISRGKTLLNYVGKTEKHLSFRQNEDIKILGKPVDDKSPDWIGTVKHKIGLVPKSMVREDKMGKLGSKFKYPLTQLPIWDSMGVTFQETTPSPTIEDITASPTIEEATASPTIEETTASPTIEEITASPTMEETTPSPTIEEETTASPTIEDTTASSTIEDTTTSPTIDDTTASPTIEEATASPSIEDTTAIPTIEETTTSPTIEDTTAIPTIEETTTSPSIEDTTAIPTIEEATASPTIEDTTASPTIEDTTASPTIEETTASPSIEDTTAIPTIEETTASPTIEDTTASSTIEETTTSPTMEDIVASSTIEDTTASPTIEETTASPTMEDIVASSTIEETTTSPTIEEITASPTMEDIVASSTIEETTTSPTIEDTTASPTIEETTASATIEEHSDTVVSTMSEIIEETTPPTEDPPTTPIIFQKVEDDETTSPPPSPPLPQDDPTLSGEVPSTEATLNFFGIFSAVTEPPLVVDGVAEDGSHEHHTHYKEGEKESSHHDHDHHHHHHLEEEEEKDRPPPLEESKPESGETRVGTILKHISSTLLSFLPEHLQDTILDVDDALVFTGIIALTLVSICVPYFVIEGFFAVRPLKKRVVELNKSLWKVSTAYENQQEEFEVYKRKALDYDEDKKRVQQLEYELVLLKKLESKQKEQVAKYQKELKTHKELIVEMQNFSDKELEKKKRLCDEKDKLKTTNASLKEALRRTVDELQDTQSQCSSVVMELELCKQSNDTATMKIGMLEKEVGELRVKLGAEVERRRSAENERDESTKQGVLVENELIELKKICGKYEETVSSLNNEISQKENELFALKETLGEDSPLVDVAEVSAKLLNAQVTIASLQSRLDALQIENKSIRQVSSTLPAIIEERDEAQNRLKVLESWFKAKEEELRKMVERYEAEKNIRGKDKDDLVKMIEEKAEEVRGLNDQLDAFKLEFEECKIQHKNEIRALETKTHENWLSLCQAERKAQDARKEAESLRQKLTALSKEGADGETEGEVVVYPMITPDMVPVPFEGIPPMPSYFGLEHFIPPPPLHLEEERREPHRPPPLGRVSPNYSDVEDRLSPIRRRRRKEESSDGNSTGSGGSSPRDWGGRGRAGSGRRSRDGGRRAGGDYGVDGRRRIGPVTSSPIHFNNL